MAEFDGDSLAYLFDSTDVHIEDERWTVMAIGGTAEEPSFHYTVGLARLGLPELITFSLPHEVGGLILNDLGDEMKKSGAPTDGEEREGVLEGYRCRFRMLGKLEDFVDTDEAKIHFGYLMRYYASRQLPIEEVEIVQLLWPDRKGHFPGEEGWSLPNKLQPLLQGTRNEN